MRSTVSSVSELGVTLRRERRRFLQAGLILAAAGYAGRAPAQLATPNDALGFLAEWEALGWHWTGTDVESNSAEWLGRVLSRAGAGVEVQTYPFERSDVTLASVRVAERRVVALPLFDGGTTAAEGIVGKLGLPASGADFAVLEVAPDNPADGALVAARHDARHRALIVITTGGRSGLAPLDVGSAGAGPHNVVVQVSSAERDWLLAAARAGAPATVIAQFAQVRTSARNVIAAVPGSDATRAPIVIWAGRSGWGPCVGERGGALFCAAHAIRGLVEARAPRGLVFVASSGEEFGQTGLDAFVKRFPDLQSHAFGWIRLGANIGTRGSALSVDGATRDWMERLRRELRIDAVRFSGDASGGTELGSEANGLTINAAPGPLFHLPTDQLPAAVDLQQINGTARALARTLLLLANS